MRKQRQWAGEAPSPKWQLLWNTMWIKRHGREALLDPIWNKNGKVGAYKAVLVANVGCWHCLGQLQTCSVGFPASFQLASALQFWDVAALHGEENGLAGHHNMQPWPWWHWLGLWLQNGIRNLLWNSLGLWNAVSQRSTPGNHTPEL